MMTWVRSEDRPAEDPGASGLEGLDDKDLAVLAMADNRAAQAALVDRHLTAVYRLCLRLLRDRDRAADSTQEVFLKAHAALGTFDPERSYRGWLLAIAWNQVRDEARRAKHRRAMSLPAAEDSGSGAWEPPDAHESSPHERLERKERHEILEEGLARLKPGSRALVLLRDMEGLSYAELSDLFGWRLGTTKSRVHRARMELKDALLSLKPGWFEPFRT